MSPGSSPEPRLCFRCNPPHYLLAWRLDWGPSRRRCPCTRVPGSTCQSTSSSGSVKRREPCSSRPPTPLPRGLQRRFLHYPFPPETNTHLIRPLYGINQDCKRRPQQLGSTLPGRKGVSSLQRETRQVRRVYPGTSLHQVRTETGARLRPHPISPRQLHPETAPPGSGRYCEPWSWREARNGHSQKCTRIFISPFICICSGTGISIGAGTATSSASRPEPAWQQPVCHEPAAPPSCAPPAHSPPSRRDFCCCKPGGGLYIPTPPR